MALRNPDCASVTRSRRYTIEGVTAPLGVNRNTVANCRKVVDRRESAQHWMEVPA